MRIRLSGLSPEIYYVEEGPETFLVPACPGGWERRERYYGSVRLLKLVKDPKRRERICREIGYA